MKTMFLKKGNSVAQVAPAPASPPAGYTEITEEEYNEQAESLRHGGELAQLQAVEDSIAAREEKRQETRKELIAKLSEALDLAEESAESLADILIPLGELNE